MQKRTAQVLNRLGLHARAAARLVQLANRYESLITIGRADNGQQVDAKSMFGVLMLAATRGTELEVEAHGADEQDAVEAVSLFIESGFGEELFM
jgi:phosphocarrier protein